MPRFQVRAMSSIESILMQTILVVFYLVEWVAAAIEQPNK